MTQTQQPPKLAHHFLSRILYHIHPLSTHAAQLTPIATFLCSTAVVCRLAAMDRVSALYASIINQVIEDVTPTFQEDGVDDQVLQDLKMQWEFHLSRAMPAANLDLAPASEPEILNKGPSEVGKEERVPVDGAATTEAPAQDGSAAAAKESEGAKKGADDDDDSSDSDDEEVEDAPNYMICRADRVRRDRGKYRVALKKAVLHANGKEYVFSTVRGEYAWQ
eukprot:m.35731 g.35731  ORF g.35731 m.35731 type:complete len:221 (-) comp9917_c0_seq2:469-1131(-)